MFTRIYKKQEYEHKIYKITRDLEKDLKFMQKRGIQPDSIANGSFLLVLDKLKALIA
ncbi:MAG: hypothetical protein ACTSUE_17440 [Promethearchaeota archaeon]